MYVVRFVGPSGAERFLSRGRLVDFDAAKWYHHPSAARRARDSFTKKYYRQVWISDIFDPKDPEKQVEL